MYFKEWRKKEGKNREGCRREFLRSSIALHPLLPDDSGQVLTMPPKLREKLASREDFGGDLNLAPFARAPEATRENRLGYSWPPRLYQVLFNLQEAIWAVNVESTMESPPLGWRRRPEW